MIGVRDWVFFDQRPITKGWDWKSDDVTFAIVPIPELFASVAIQGSASAHAGFVASIGPGALRNIRVGITRKQYAELFLVGLDLAVPLLGLGAFRVLDSFRALADIDVVGHLSVNLTAGGEIQIGRAHV